MYWAMLLGPWVWVFLGGGGGVCHVGHLTVKQFMLRFHCNFWPNPPLSAHALVTHG